MEIKIKYDEVKDELKVEGTKDGWLDLGLLLEAVGVTAAASVGKNPHNIKTFPEMKEYLKQYIERINWGFSAELPPTN